MTVSHDSASADSAPPPPGTYEFLDFNAPLSDARANALARSLAASSPGTVLDVGCGWGELLLRVLAAAPRATGVGVDSNPALLARGRDNAGARELSSRIRFVQAEAISVREPADVVLCVGSDHAFGDQATALQALFDRTAPGGRLLFGSGFWTRPPTQAQAESVGLTPESLTDLAGLVDAAIGAGFRPLFVQTANQDEWEHFESGFLADWEEWLHSYGDTDRAGEIRALADTHRNEWLHGWGDVLGFAYLTLGRRR